ncbi:alpha/beta fold hydrolase [Paenibacillus gansuensis]|uniref:Alpha/beta fold hydrolase n=1 Tax=Paenibacillus gansuensis TaxID=306542 RepID=A0ABW5P9C1_9BACL
MQYYDQSLTNTYYQAAFAGRGPVFAWPNAGIYPPSLNWNYGYHHPVTQPAWGPHYLPRSEHEQGLEQRQRLTFVLIHGSWADASFWDGIAAELRRMGHTVHVPEYPGHGADPNKNVTHAMITKSVADYITSRNLQNIILVGHSFGGTIIQKVSEMIPDRIKRLVFYNAFVLKDGQSVADELPAPAREAFEQLRKGSRDDTIMLPFPVFRETFANLASLATAQQLYNQIPPEPAKPLFEKLDLKKFYSLEIPKSYLFLTEDNVLPQGEGFGFHPHMSIRLGLFRLIKERGDHISTAKTEPKKVAQRIFQAARD